MNDRRCLSCGKERVEHFGAAEYCTAQGFALGYGVAYSPDETALTDEQLDALHAAGTDAPPYVPTYYTDHATPHHNED